MLELAVAGNPRLAVERIELTLPAPSYTVRTLRALAQREPGNRFTLLLGADAAQDLPAWHEAAALPGLADIVVYARPGTGRSEEHTSELQSQSNIVCRLLLEKKKKRNST